MSEFSFKRGGVAADLLKGISTPERRKLASMAVNKIALQARAEMARRALQDINLPAQYVQPGSKRLYISQKASAASLAAIITAKRRPMSLARFVVGPSSTGKGLRVMVKQGSPQDLERAFLIRLRSGRALTDTQYNMGLAIRLPKGQTPSATSAAKEIAPGLYLLYGPSLAQLLENRAGTGIGADLAPDLEADLMREFSRLLELNLA